MSYYDELKSKINILSVATELGFNGQNSGSTWQGDCPQHGSSKGRCLTIYPDTQSFHCFHCEVNGDVIGLVELFKGCDHRTAVNFLADSCGMPRLGASKLSPAEQAKLDADYQEEKLVKEMLTAAAVWYHGQLASHPDIRDYLRDHYKFSDRIIDELKIGFAPVTATNQPSQLVALLNGLPGFKGNLYLSGLFVAKDPLQGPYYDFFQGRITFPYWKNGQVTYFKARATTLTPVTKYECYPDDQDQPRVDSAGVPDYIKYKALRSHDAKDDKKKYISKFIQNNTFLGEDTIRGAREVIITEGVPDWVSAVDHGFAAISPGTTNFRRADFEKLAHLTQAADSIYIINDNEENQAGENGARNTGSYLASQGKNVFIVELPRPEGTNKIDLNEYLLNHDASALRKLMEDSKAFLDMLIEELPENFIKALPQVRTDIAPILAQLEGGVLEHYVEALKTRLKTSKKAVTAENEAAAKRLADGSFQSSEPLDPEVHKKVEEIAQDRTLFKKRLDLINQAGVVRERNIIAMYYATLDSRLLPDDRVSPNVLAIKNAGHFGAGKSYTLSMVLTIYPKSCYHMITNGSAKSLYYLKGGLKHKALIVTEGFQLQQNHAQDSELVYTLRTLISEGKLSYWTVQKNEEGHQETFLRELAGPTSFITTTVMEKLEEQTEDRLLTIHPNESLDQTREILTFTGNLEAGLIPKLDKQVIKAWRAFHESLKPVEVVIPYAPKIVAHLKKNPILPISTRRAFKRVLSVIKAIVCAYQHQRQRNQNGQVIAEMGDYWMALQVVQESFQENMGKQSPQNEAKIAFIAQKGVVQAKDLKDAWGVSGTAITNWISPQVKEGVLQWCDQEANLFPDVEALKKAKSAGKAFIKVAPTYLSSSSVGLPSPYELTGDLAWTDSGYFSKQYDLQLKGRVSTGVNGVFTPQVDTVNDSKQLDNITESEIDGGGVKVSTPTPIDLGEYFKDCAVTETEEEMVKEAQSYDFLTF